MVENYRHSQTLIPTPLSEMINDSHSLNDQSTFDPDFF